MPVPVTVKTRRLTGSPRLFSVIFGPNISAGITDRTNNLSSVAEELYNDVFGLSDYKAMLTTVQLQSVFREQQGANAVLHTQIHGRPS